MLNRYWLPMVLALVALLFHFTVWQSAAVVAVGLIVAWKEKEIESLRERIERLESEHTDPESGRL